MCGRYTIRSTAQVIAETFDVDEPIELAPRYNVCPGQDVPVVRIRRDEERRSLDLLRWGLVPWFSKEPAPAARMINARAESAATSPAFREALRQRRCLVPADGFYEWRAGETKRAPKQPFFFERDDGRPIAFAGLWERWKGKDGRRIESCAILTMSPNELVRGIHDRMPVILPPDVWSRWLDRELQDADAVLPLLVPAPPEGMVATPVGTWVNDPKHDDPACIAPVADDAPESEQRDLFR